jgi:hypothetical protein
MENELDYERQMIFEVLDPFYINNDKDSDEDSSEESHRKLKHKKKNNENNQNLKHKKLNFYDNDDNINVNNQQKRIVIKTHQMIETLNMDWSKVNNDNTDWSSNTEWTKEYLFKYYNRLNNWEGTKQNNNRNKKLHYKTKSERFSPLSTGKMEKEECHPLLMDIIDNNNSNWIGNTEFTKPKPLKYYNSFNK